MGRAAGPNGVGCFGYGWADNGVGVGVCCMRCFLRTAGDPVAWPVLGRARACGGGVLCAVGPEGSVGWRVFCECSGAPTAGRVIGFRFSCLL